MTEHNTQRLLVAWFRATYPELRRLLLAIPNGGKRDRATAARLKAEGVLAGAPDLLLARPTAGWPGLFLELKTPRGRLSPDQIDMRDDLEAQGYAVVAPKGYEAARDAIRNYLAGQHTQGAA